MTVLAEVVEPDDREYLAAVRAAERLRKWLDLEARRHGDSVMLTALRHALMVALKVAAESGAAGEASARAFLDDLGRDVFDPSIALVPPPAEPVGRQPGERTRAALRRAVPWGSA